MVNKKILIILGIIIVAVLLFLIFVLSKLSRAKNTETPEILKSGSAYSIVQTRPQNNARDVSTSQNISVEFSRPLSETEKSVVRINSNPPTTGTLEWSDANRTVTYVLGRPFGSDETYVFFVDSSSRKTSFTFSTKNAEDLTQNEVEHIQAASDKEFGDWWANIDTNYPWFRKLPLDDPQKRFFVYFDLDLKKFVATIYADPSLVNELQVTIQNDLKNLGVDLTRFEIVWELK